MKTLLASLVLGLVVPATTLAQQDRADLPVTVTFRNAPGDAVRGDPHTPCPLDRPS